MALREEDQPASKVEYPRFDHGEDLLVLIRGDGSLEFRSESTGEYVKADNAVTVADKI